MRSLLGVDSPSGPVEEEALDGLSLSGGKKVAEPTVERLVCYRRLLGQLRDEGRRVVSSQDIGELLQIKASQVRKDLSCFGEIGKRGVGYHVERLLEHIQKILASPHMWRMALVGVGNLGAALAGYKALRGEKFSLEALFDIDAAKIDQTIAGVPCFPMSALVETLREREIQIVLLAVPASAAQECVDLAVRSGTVRGILNFVPASVVAPEGVLVFGVDISVALEKLLFYLKQEESPGSGPLPSAMIESMEARRSHF